MSGLHDWELTTRGELGARVHSTHDEWTCRTCGHTSVMPKGREPSAAQFVERWSSERHEVGCNETVVERVMGA